MEISILRSNSKQDNLYLMMINNTKKKQVSKKEQYSQRMQRSKTKHQKTIVISLCSFQTSMEKKDWWLKLQLWTQKFHLTMWWSQMTSLRKRLSIGSKGSWEHIQGQISQRWMKEFKAQSRNYYKGMALMNIWQLLLNVCLLTRIKDYIWNGLLISKSLLVFDKKRNNI